MNLRFDRNEWAGSFGDIGTDLPLLLGIVLASGLDAGNVFSVFGLLQIATGLLYGLPMPLQPLKAMAVLVISQKIEGGVLLGGGLAVGAVMLLLTLTGGLDLLVRWIPRSVVRGIQFGLGLSLASLALKTYVPSMGRAGWALAAAGTCLMLLLWGNRRVPGGLLLVALGAAFAFWKGLDLGVVLGGVGFSSPALRVPSPEEVWRGFWLLALPQIPLSLSNSIIATHQTLRDLFPHRRVGVRKIGLTYAAVNLAAPFLGGVPACHGCGGLCGHYAFGARTGGSVVLYGTFYLVTGLFLSSPLGEVVKIFPQPLLGVVLFFEALALMALVRDTAAAGRDLAVALLTGIVAFAVPHGFVAGLFLGTLVFYGFRRYGVEVDERAAPG